MPRMRISAEGIEIAKEDFDVDTAAPENFIFSSKLPTLRLALTGVVTLTGYSGPLSTRFARAIVYYDEPFAKPPLVLAAGIVSSTDSDQAPFVSQSLSGWARWVRYSVASFTDRLEIYGYHRNVDGNLAPRPTRTYRYYVFHNTIDDGS